MLELLALGKLAQSRAFQAHDVAPETLDAVHITTDHQDAWYLEMIEPLTALGRTDLVDAIRRKSSNFRRRLAWEEERDWKGRVKQIDRRYLGSSVYRSYKSVRAYVKNQSRRASMN
jgi:predicted RecB family nuclease